MAWNAAPTGKRGRQQTYRDTAIQTCLTMKVLFGMALRQTTGFVESLLRLVGLDWTVPDFSTLSRRQKTLAVNIPYRGSEGALHLLIDSTGIKVEGKGEWHARKHGGPKRRVWRKIQIGIDEGQEDHERPQWGVSPTFCRFVPSIGRQAIWIANRPRGEITASHIGDAPILRDLLSQIPAGEEIGSVTADGAYDTRKCHDTIADRGAHAVIPPRKNAKPSKTVIADTVTINEALRAAKYLSRAIWRNWSGYHRRSRAKTKKHCMKLLGQRLMAQDFDRQVAEVQNRIGVMNGYSALGIPVTETVG